MTPGRFMVGALQIEAAAGRRPLSTATKARSSRTPRGARGRPPGSGRCEDGGSGLSSTSRCAAVGWRLLARGGGAVHAAGVLLGERAYLLVGPSGCGKTDLGASGGRRPGFRSLQRRLRARGFRGRTPHGARLAVPSEGVPSPVPADGPWPRSCCRVRPPAPVARPGHPADARSPHRGQPALLRRRRGTSNRPPRARRARSRRALRRAPSPFAPTRAGSTSWRTIDRGYNAPMPPFAIVSAFQPTGDQPRAIEQLTRGLAEGAPRPGAARRHRLRKDVHDRAGRGGGAAPGAASSPTTRRWPRSSTRSSSGSSRTTRSSTSSRTTTTTSPRRTSRSPTRTSRRNRRSTRRSTGCATPRRARCSSGATR